MPTKPKKPLPELPAIPRELIDQFVTGPDSPSIGDGKPRAASVIRAKQCPATGLRCHDELQGRCREC